MYQSTDSGVQQDAQVIRDEILSSDNLPQPSTDINDYTGVLDKSEISNYLTEILFSYTDSSDPENEGLLKQLTMHFDGKPDDVETWLADLSTPLLLSGNMANR